MGTNHNNRSFVRLIPFITAFAFALIFLAPGFNAFAQVDQGSITGTVTDPSGAVVPNAKVTLLNTDQGLTLETTSTGAGEYTFSPVRIGHYNISVSAAGFATTTQQGLTVNVSQNLRINIQLKPGSATQTVEVTATPPQLQTQDASVGQVVNSQSVNNLPLNGRNFTFLAQISAGVNSPQEDSRGNAANGAFSANGLRPAQNNYLLDGIDNNSDNVDFLNGTNFVVLPPPDAIQEFKVQTSDYSAELGRAAGAVLNATVKSGTNQIHGAVWEFFRNNVLDAADWFENNNGIPRAELRWNMFGGSIGGPIIKNKIFYFGDYQGFRHVQGNTQSGLNVPTALQRTSGYTNLSELITANTGTKTDALGRTIPIGTVLDPATTRPAPGGNWVRDPFTTTCPASTMVYSLAACPDLNQIPASRIDSNAIPLLNLFPNPTTSGVYSNFASSPNLTQFNNQFDVRADFNISDKDQVFARTSYWDNPQYIPGPFGGIADGGGFQDGIQTAKSFQGVAAYTHVFSPTTVNVARIGWDHLHTSRFGPKGTEFGIPAQYGIADIPQTTENGGLPAYGFGGLSTLGSNSFLPSDETTQTTQVTDDFSKVYQAHSFKMGIEFQHVRFNTLQPAWSKGQWDYNGSFTDIPSNNSSTTGIAQFLLPPVASPGVPGGVSGGSDFVYASNINKTYDLRKYFAAYFQDDWKINPKLTLNMGLRYDYFGPINETNGGQANFVWNSGPPNGTPTFLIPASGKDNRALSTASPTNGLCLPGSPTAGACLPGTTPVGFTDLLAKDGIALEFTNKYGQGLLQAQHYNFAPRFGLAYQLTPKWVIRTGAGLFYNAFENQGYGPNIGENYPFVYNFQYGIKVPSSSTASPVAPVSYQTPYANCPTAGGNPATGNGVPTFESGFSCIAFTPTVVNASGLGLQGLQFKFITPKTVAFNLSVQYAITRTLSAQVGYVMTNANNLQVNLGANNVTALLPYNSGTTGVPGGEPYPDFGGGSSGRMIGASNYNGLQMKLEQQLDNGLNYLVTYTFSKTFTDAGDLLNGGNVSQGRAVDVPGFGLRQDWGLASFNITNVVHISGGYELPFGKNKPYANNLNKVGNFLVGGWSTNGIVTLQGGQPITLGCPTGTVAGSGCYDIQVPGESQKLGIKVRPDASGHLLPFWFNNPAAFQQACQMVYNAAGALVPTNTPSGCIPRTGFGALGNRPTTVNEGPGFHRFDISIFKNIPITERINMQFRSEFFNIFNHPNFNAPGFGGNGVIAIPNSTNFTNSNFGAIGSTLGAPYAPREIQFALKLYY
jgi:hypothetical protein